MLNKHMNTSTTTRASGHGGARPGAGRPRGSGNKVNLEDLLMDIELETQMPFTRRLAINYSSAIDRSDWARVENYDRAFLNKIVADRNQVEVTDSSEALELKRAAFAAALAALAGSAAAGDVA
jgi:hypothetical protein